MHDFSTVHHLNWIEFPTIYMYMYSFAHDIIMSKKWTKNKRNRTFTIAFIFMHKIYSITYIGYMAGVRGRPSMCCYMYYF